MRRRLVRLFGYSIALILFLRIYTYIYVQWIMTQDKLKSPIEKFSLSYMKESMRNGNENAGKNDKNVKASREKFEGETMLGKINVYTYRDVCSYTDTYNLYWNPLFPKYPYRRYFANKLEDDELLTETVSRRFVGYLYVNVTGYYTFQMQSRNGIEFVVYDGNLDAKKAIARFGIYDRDIRDQSAKEPPLFSQISDEIVLKNNRRYIIDLVQTVFLSGRFLLRFKSRNDSHYSPIEGAHIAPYAMLSDSIPENHFFKAHYLNGESYRNDARLSLTKVALNSGTLSTGLMTCSYTPSYLFAGKEVSLYTGQYYVKTDLIYPDDQSGYVNLDSKVNRLLDATVAKKVAEDILASINAANERAYKLQNIVHVEENSERRRYFVELDLQNTTDGRSYRFSDYVLKATHSSDQLCLPKGYSNQWRHNVTIYLVCAVKNQRQWFQYLIQSTEQLIKRTNEQNLHLIVVDFHSSDADLKAYLQGSKLNYTLLQMEGNFSKVKALNEGVRHIPSNDSIVFVMDLHLQVPDHIFDQARKHTIEGRMAYSPILIRLQCGEHPEFTEIRDSRWMEQGYGMLSIYKSDWERIGGMNEEIFSHKWGGEDWEFVDRIILSRLELVHQRLPGFYHIYHTTDGTWDGTKLF